VHFADLTFPGFVLYCIQKERKGYKKMYEYEIYNERTNEHNFICGYSREDAWRRNKDIDRNEWKIIYAEYID